MTWQETSVPSLLPHLLLIIRYSFLSSFLFAFSYIFCIKRWVMKFCKYQLLKSLFLYLQQMYLVIVQIQILLVKFLFFPLFLLLSCFSLSLPFLSSRPPSLPLFLFLFSSFYLRFYQTVFMSENQSYTCTVYSPNMPTDCATLFSLSKYTQFTIAKVQLIINISIPLPFNNNYYYYCY